MNYKKQYCTNNLSNILKTWLNEKIGMVMTVVSVHLFCLLLFIEILWGPGSQAWVHMGIAWRIWTTNDPWVCPTGSPLSGVGCSLGIRIFFSAPRYNSWQPLRTTVFRELTWWSWTLEKWFAQDYMVGVWCNQDQALKYSIACSLFSVILS